jgi:hypothetical protein
MIYPLALLLLFCVIGCDAVSDQPESIELITRISQQDSLFNNLLQISGNTLSQNSSTDSLAFLILPLQASCPSCRKKTIDSILKHQKKLADNHFIILSANGGRKTISAFFREQNSELPNLPHQIILDSTNQAFKYNLYKDNPAIYYAGNRKVYKKVSAIPATVKQDLQEFFTGFRDYGDKK